MADPTEADPPRSGLMEAVTSLAKRRGIAFQSSEIYGVCARPDYGPLGTELKRNVREQWWRTMVPATTSSAWRPP